MFINSKQTQSLLIHKSLFLSKSPNCSIVIHYGQRRKKWSDLVTVPLHVPVQSRTSNRASFLFTSSSLTGTPEASKILKLLQRLSQHLFEHLSVSLQHPTWWRPPAAWRSSSARMDAASWTSTTVTGTMTAGTGRTSRTVVSVTSSSYRLYLKDGRLINDPKVKPKYLDWLLVAGCSMDH